MTSMDYIENIILTKGTKGDKLDMLALFALRTKDTKYIRELLKYTHGQRNDVIYHALSNLIDLLPISPVFLKQKILREFQIQSNNQFIADKVLRLMLNSDLFYEFKDIIINKLGSKKHSLDVKRYVLRQCGSGVDSNGDVEMANKTEKVTINGDKIITAENKGNSIAVNHSLMNLYVKSDERVKTTILEIFISTNPGENIIREIFRAFVFGDMKMNSAFIKLIHKYEIDKIELYGKVREFILSTRCFTDMFDDDGVCYFLDLIKHESFFIKFFVKNVCTIKNIEVIKILYQKMNSVADGKEVVNTNNRIKNSELIELKTHLKRILLHQNPEILIGILIILEFKTDSWSILRRHYDLRVRNLANRVQSGDLLKDSYVLSILERVKLSIHPDGL